MSNAELIEQTASLLVTVAYAHQEFDNYDHVLHHGNVKKLTDALELADKRIAELESRLAVARVALQEVDDLIGESSGVIGLHLNGDVAPWDELLGGGRFECLTTLQEALAQIGGDDAG